MPLRLTYDSIAPSIGIDRILREVINVLFIENLHFGREPENSQTVDPLVRPEAPLGFQAAKKRHYTYQNAGIQCIFEKKSIFFKAKAQMEPYNLRKVFFAIFTPIQTSFAKKGNRITAF